MVLSSTFVVIVLALLGAAGLAFAWALYSIRGLRTDVRDLLDAFQKAHGNGYSDPSAAAVVTDGREPSPAPVSGSVPVPAVARAVLPLPSVARSVVSVTRDDDPVHTRATVAAPQPKNAPELDETTRSRLRRIGRDETAMAREAWAERVERTAIYSAEPGAADDQIPGVEVRPRSDRPTLLGGLLDRALVPAPRAPVSRPTLISAGYLAPSPVEARYEALCAAARAVGLAVDHCHSDACEPGDDDRAAPPGVDAEQWHAMGAVGLCHCYCDGCARATTFAEQAEREVMGPPIGAPDPRKPRG